MKAKVSEELRKILQDPDASADLIRKMLSRDRKGRKNRSFEVHVGNDAFSVRSGPAPVKKTG
jgi:hypothetical protein